MKTTLLLAVIFSNFLFASPPKAKGMQDAKYVLCDNADYEYFLSFKDAKLKKGNYGMTTGSIGVVEYGFRKKGAEFEKGTVKYPSLIANGPSTTIQVGDKNNLVAFAKTYDFQTAKGELSSKSVPKQKCECVFYTDAVY